MVMTNFVSTLCLVLVCSAIFLGSRTLASAQESGLDGIYIGPSDLALAYGSPDAAYGASPPGFDEAVDRVRQTAA